MTQVPAPNSSADAGEIDYVQIALRHKVLLAAGLLLGVGAGHLVYQQMGPEYVATGKILVSKKASVQLREGDSHDAGGRGEHIALIMSPLIVEQAVELGRLNELPSMRKSKDVVEDIVAGLKVQRSAGQDSSVLNVLDITYKATNRQDAQKVVDAIIEAYDEFLGEIHRKRITELTKHIAEANGSLRDQIHKTEREYEEFRAAAPIHLKSQTRGPGGERTGTASNIHQENLEVLDKERQQLLLRKSELLSQIQSIESGLANGQSREELSASIQLFNTTVRAPQDAGAGVNSAAGALNPLNPLAANNAARPENSSLESQWLALKLQQEQLILNYGPEWPAIETIRRQLALIEWQFRQKGLKLPSEATALAGTPGVPGAPGTVPGAAKADLVSLYVSSLRQQLDVVQRREMEISRVYSVEFDNARLLSRYVEQDRHFHDDLDRMNSLWNVVREQAAKVDLQKDNREYAMQSISPIRTTLSIKRLIKLYGAGLGAVMGATCGLIGLFELRRRQNSTATTQVTTKAATAVAPAATAAPAVPVRPAVTTPFTTLGSIPQLVPAAGGDADSALCVHHRANSPEAIAFKATAQSLLAQLPAASTAIQVVSAARGDGNSFVIANLGLAIAATGKRVLIIDADYTNPVQHAQFGLRNDIGLVDVLSEDLDLLTASRPTVVVGLHVLPSGQASSELDLSSEAFRLLLVDARRELDVVLIDSPSFSDSTQAIVIAQRAEHAVFVWRPHHSNAEQVQNAVTHLQRGQCTVIGAIATDCITGSVPAPKKPVDINAPLDPAAFRQLAKVLDRQ